MNNETIVKALETMVAALNAQLQAAHPGSSSKFEFELGRRYARVFRRDGVGRQCYAFVELTFGDIYKPASWKSPAKGVRANIFASDYMKACGVYGVARAR